MSNKISRNNRKFSVRTNRPYPVIVKGFMGEPVRMDALGTENNLVTLAKKSSKTRITLKSKYVYHYDKETFERLKEKFERKDEEGLVKVWQEATRIIVS